jgi:hypothetical protein
MYVQQPALMHFARLVTRCAVPYPLCAALSHAHDDRSALRRIEKPRARPGVIAYVCGNVPPSCALVKRCRWAHVSLFAAAASLLVF